MRSEHAPGQQQRLLPGQRGQLVRLESVQEQRRDPAVREADDPDSPSFRPRDPSSPITLEDYLRNAHIKWNGITLGSTGLGALLSFRYRDSAQSRAEAGALHRRQCIVEAAGL